MTRAKAIACALLAAVFAPTLLVTLFFAGLMALSLREAYTSLDTELRVVAIVFVTAIAISASHVVALGVPALWLLHRLDRFRVWPIAAAGFVAGCIPMAVWSWPLDNSPYLSSSSTWEGGKEVFSKVDGVPTLRGWIQYTEGVALAGAFGLAAALAFWWAWKRLR